MFEQILKDDTRTLTQPMHRGCSPMAAFTLGLTLALTLSLVHVPAHAARDMNNIVIASSAENNPSERLDKTALENLVAPIALYPDDLIAIVLPASTDPVAVVLAARSVKGGKNHSSNTHDELTSTSAQSSARQAIEALKHYPDVLAKMHDDLDWTQALGEATTLQQADLLGAIQDYRKAAANSGFLRNDEHQVIDVADNTVMIRPKDAQVIYVPDYTPRQVVVYRTAPRRAMRYHVTPAPVYYRRYSSSHRYHHVTEDWHGPTFALSWRDGHIQRRNRHHSGRKHYRTGQRIYLHNNKSHRKKYNRHHDNRQRGFIEHTPRSRYSTHNNRQHTSSRHARNNRLREDNRGTGKPRHNRHQNGYQQRHNRLGGERLRNNAGEDNKSRRSAPNEPNKLRAWKG